MKQIEELDLDGYAIGGLAVGEPAQEMYRIIEAVEPYMPEEKPRYLMGVGTPVNIWRLLSGIDLFDCVMPSRNARHGHLFTWAGIRNLNNAKYILDDQPIDEACDCPICQNYSRAYLHHLFKANEMLGMRLAVMHNIYFYNTLLEKIRFALDQGQFEVLLPAASGKFSIKNLKICLRRGSFYCYNQTINRGGAFYNVKCKSYCEKLCVRGGGS